MKAAASLTGRAAVLRNVSSSCAQRSFSSPQSHFLTQGHLCRFWRPCHRLCWKLMTWESFFAAEVRSWFSAKRTDWQGRAWLGTMPWVPESSSPQSITRTGSTSLIMEGCELPFPVLDFKASLSNLQNKAGFHFCSMSSTKIAAKYSSYTAFDALLKVPLLKRKTESGGCQGACARQLYRDFGAWQDNSHRTH